MKKRLIFLYPLMLVALLMSTLPITYPAEVMADSGKGISIGTKFVLDNNIEAAYKGKTLDGDYKWEATIGAPKYCDDLVTPIECRWEYNTATNSWITKANLFSASAKDGKVTVEYQGAKMHWQPQLKIGGKVQSSGMVILLINDPINENYWGNTLQWDYGNGITRNLRVIEGMLIEYYTIDKLPSGDISIKANTVKDAGFVWTRPVVAWDSNDEPVVVLLDGHDVTLTLDAMKTATFPITIDPDTTFTTSASDGMVAYTNEAIYATAHDAASANYLSALNTWNTLGQQKRAFWEDYSVYRDFVYFDTSGLGDSVTVTAAVLRLYGEEDSSDVDFDITVQEGMPTYPHDPLEVGDYLFSHYAGAGGTLGTAGFSVGAYNNITLTATGYGWINATGITKLVLRSSRDIASTAPSGADWIKEYVKINTYEKGAGYRPQLVVTYTASALPSVTTNNATYVTQTTARLNSYLGDDGGEACDARFQYNVTALPFNATNCTVWTYNTTWVNDTYVTGNSPYNDTSGLVNNTSYCFRVQARNTIGTINGTPLYFTTVSDLFAPTNFKAYPSSDHIDLTWIKGSGSVKTRVVGQVGVYPANYTDGTLVYNGTASTATHSGLSPGTAYYYRAWGVSDGNYSVGYANVTVVTLAGLPGTGTPSAPDIPTGWWETPDYTVLSDLPMYSIVNDLSDDYGIPRNTVWVIGSLLLFMGIGLFIYSISHNLIMPILVVGVLMFMAANAGLMPMWFMIAYGLPAISIVVIEARA